MRHKTFGEAQDDGDINIHSAAPSPAGEPQSYAITIQNGEGVSVIKVGYDGDVKWRYTSARRRMPLDARHATSCARSCEREARRALMTLELRGLSGVKRKSLEAQIFRRPDQASRLLRTNRAITAADSNGAVNVWRDDAGLYRAEFYQHCVTKASWRGKQKTRLTEWLKTWMPKMRAA